MEFARIRNATLAALVLALPWFAVTTARAEGSWLEIDYARLVDRRQLTHSGEPVGVVLDRLAGRPLPPPGERTGDRLAHSLLDPLLETYAFVLPDALDTINEPAARPLIELGQLWEPGEAQPAWVELLRARRYLVESDGAGRLRVFLPLAGTQTAPEGESREGARAAFVDAWPVLRLVLAAERDRLGAAGEPPPLEVEVHAYRHLPARSVFYLGVDGERATIEDTRSDGRHPPLDLDRLRRFLDAGWQVEGGRLEPDGTLRLFGSREEGGPTLLGRPIDLADLAVAYRAVFHGGLAEPYMSLDRGFSPQTSVVNYGGRLRDTALGLVSLLCDIRFKTFSLGIDIVTGEDIRDRVRRTVPGFATHIERFAADPDSRGVLGQQTRLWFYPDNVDLTVSPQVDVLAMRRVRMSAASERVSSESLTAQKGEDPPWTRATVQAINRDYDMLHRVFPELADLDQVVRALAFFTWLRQAASAGAPVPELEAILATQLPAVPTPRTFPQLLAFNALSDTPDGVAAAVHDQVPVGEGLERLNGVGPRPLPAVRRFRRAVGALDPGRRQSASLLEELEAYDAGTLTETMLDLQAYRAERVRMHQTVLRTLDPPLREQLAAREQAGQSVRVFSVGIGGLDLGMEQVLERARGQSLGLGSSGLVASAATGRRSASGPSSRTSSTTTATRTAPVSRPEWRTAPERGLGAPVPRHGWEAAGESGRTRFGNHWIERRAEGDQRWVWTLFGEDGPEVRSRRLRLDADGDVASVDRFEQGRRVHYVLERSGEALRTVPVPDSPPAPPALSAPGVLGDGLATLQVAIRGLEGGAETPGVPVRLDSRVEGRAQSLEAELPRGLLQRLIMGRRADLTPGKPLAAFSPLPERLGRVETLLVLQSEAERTPPWDRAWPSPPGEESATRLAAALRDWWAADPAVSTAAGVATDPGRSGGRWAAAPRPEAALLLLPEDGFPDYDLALRDALAAAWGDGPSAAELPERLEAQLVVLVTREAPGVFASRMRALADSPQLAGKLLAGWCLGGPVREDLAASLLATTGLAGVGVAEWSVVATRGVETRITALAGSVRAAGGTRRIETLPGPFVWFF